MMKLAILLLAACAFQAGAAVTCSTTVTGTTHCSGTDNTGQPVSSESFTTGTGTTYIKTQSAGVEKQHQCYTTATGTTYCE